MASARLRRQLRKLVEKQHGDVKNHPAQQVGGLIVRLLREQEYGFIKSPEGEEVYFHKNSLAGDDLDRLEVGPECSGTGREGNDGPQASTVRIIDKPAK